MGDCSGGLRGAGGCGTAGVAAPALPGCGRRWESRARGRVGAASGAAAGAAPRGEAPGTPKSDSLHPHGMCLRGGAGNGDAAPGCEGNKILDQKSRGDPGSGGTGRAPCSAFCYLHLIIWLPSLSVIPSQLASAAEKGHFGLLQKGTEHPIFWDPSQMAQPDALGLLTPLGLGS